VPNKQGGVFLRAVLFAIYHILTFNQGCSKSCGERKRHSEDNSGLHPIM